MNSEPRQRISYLVSTFNSYKMLLIVPAITGLVLATLYALFVMPEMWTARQSFLIRDDLSGTSFKPGRFDSEESRKSAQETILEVARRPRVIRSVLKQLGPDSVMASGKWLTDELIEDTQMAIDINAPNGAEFGKTDAIVLTAKSSSRERTRKFIEILSEEISIQTNQIRSKRFESMESESRHAYESASTALNDAINRLNDLDQLLGSDFVFLSLKEGQTTGVEAIKSEILRKEDELEKAQSILAALEGALNDPASASQLPSEVAAGQPKLENTMSKLLDLQEQLHIAKGLYSNRHPQVRALAKAMEFSQQQLYNSLSGEIAGVRGGIQLKKLQLVRLNNRIKELKARLIRLSKARSEHLALTTQVQQLGEGATLAKTTWGGIKSLVESARSAGLLIPTDVAQVNTRPDGLGKGVIAIAGLMGGLMIGIGLIFALAPPMVTKPISSPASTPAPQASYTNTSRMQQQPIATPTGNFTTAGNSVSNASFQQAASAMQSAANAMQIAATTEPQPGTTSAAPTQQPTAAIVPQPRPTAQPQQQPEAEYVPPANTKQKAPLGQPAAALPRNAFLQPASQPTNQPTIAPQQHKPNPAPANVRPVDLAKSASENNEFVRVNTDSETTPLTSKTSKSARAIADSVSSSPASSLTQRTPSATIALSDDEKVQVMDGTSNQTSSNTDPFVLNRNGGTTQNQTKGDNNNLNDAIPEQIRKLSDSIMKFGKDKK